MNSGAGQAMTNNAEPASRRAETDLPSLMSISQATFLLLPRQMAQVLRRLTDGVDGANVAPGAVPTFRKPFRCSVDSRLHYRCLLHMAVLNAIHR